jgi:hypothetical protein
MLDSLGGFLVLSFVRLKLAVVLDLDCKLIQLILSLSEKNPLVLERAEAERGAALEGVRIFVLLDIVIFVVVVGLGEDSSLSGVRKDRALENKAESITDMKLTFRWFIISLSSKSLSSNHELLSFLILKTSSLSLSSSSLILFRYSSSKSAKSWPAKLDRETIRFKRQTKLKDYYR